MKFDEIYLRLAKKIVSDCEHWVNTSPEGSFKENRKAIVKRLRPLIQAYENETDPAVRRKIAEAIMNEFTS